MNNGGFRLKRVLVPAIAWVALSALAVWFAFACCEITSLAGVALALAIAAALSIAGALRPDWARAAGSALLVAGKWALAAALMALIAACAGILVAGVPPVWGAWVLLAVAAGVWAWHLSRRVVSIARLALISAAMVVLAGQVWNLRMSALQKRLKAEGLPVTIADFARDLPASRNAAPAMEKVMASYSRTATGDPKGFLEGVSGVIGDVDGQGLLMKENAEFDDCRRWNASSAGILDAGARRYARIFRVVGTELTPVLLRYDARVACDFKAEEGKASPYMPRLAQFVTMNRVYRIMAERKAMGGDLAGAWATVALEVRLADLVAQDPYLIAKMIAVADAGIAVSTASAILKNRPGAVIPAPLAKAMARQAAARWVQEGFAAEIAYLFHGREWDRRSGFWKPPKGEYDETAEWQAMKAVGWTGIIDAKSRGTVVNVYLPLARTQAWPGSPAQKGDALEAYPEWIDRWIPWGGCPRFASLVQKQFELATRIRLVLAASAVHAYRSRAGRCPAKLSELAGKGIDAALLVDDFTGRELAYKAVKGGFELSSPGPWGKGCDSRGQVLAYREPVGAGKPGKPGKPAK